GRGCRAEDGGASSTGSSPGPNADERSATNAIQSASRADKASTRKRSVAAPLPAPAPSRTTSTHNTTLAANEATARPTPIQPTRGLYGRTRIATTAAMSGGNTTMTSVNINPVRRQERIL